MNRTEYQQVPWQHCPFLGLHDDSSTSLAYASPWNYCYRSNPPDSILTSYQSKVCLCPGFAECRVYHSTHWKRLPSELRGTDKSTRLNKPSSTRFLRLFELLLLLTILLIILLYAERFLP